MKRFNLKLTGLEDEFERDFHFNFLHKFDISYQFDTSEARLEQINRAELVRRHLGSVDVAKHRLDSININYKLGTCFCENTECILLPAKRRTVLYDRNSLFLSWPPILFIKSPTISCNIMLPSLSRNTVYMFFVEEYVNSLEEITHLYVPPFCFGESGQMCLDIRHNFYFNEKSLPELIDYTLTTQMQIYSKEILDLWETRGNYPFGYISGEHMYRILKAGQPLSHLGIYAQIE